MRKWVIGVFALFAILTAVFGYLYHYGGLKQYFAMIGVVNNLPSEEQIEMYTELTGANKRGGEYGVLAGNWFGRVWIWQIGRLKHIKTDQYTAYSYFDGCREDVRARMNRGERSVIQQEIFTEIDKWQEKAQVGDFVTVYLANPANGSL